MAVFRLRITRRTDRKAGLQFHLVQSASQLSYHIRLDVVYIRRRSHHVYVFQNKRFAHLFTVRCRTGNNRSVLVY